ncbi:MAG: tellurium resistance protein TerC, partial [Candidatus Portnoybacteria bacterium CG_4_9_14_3_um_filter_44_9]
MVLDWAFVCGLLSVIAIDLVLAGDNAVVIAMAVKALPKQQRRKGIVLGVGAAVAMRVVLTFFVAQLLQIVFLKLVGGVLIAWIAVKLFVDGVPDGSENKGVGSISQAIRFIVIADLSMSLDNM